MSSCRITVLLWYCTVRAPKYSGEGTPYSDRISDVSDVPDVSDVSDVDVSYHSTLYCRFSLGQWTEGNH